MHSFTTERLLIRPLAKQDKALYISLYTDAKIMRNIGEPLTTAAADKAFYNTLKAMQKPQPNVMTWAIVTLANNECIGVQGLKWETPNIAEIGIMLLRTSNGRLLPEEAMGALMEYSFNYLSINKINAFYTSKNLATKRFVKKLGFIFEQEKQPKEPNACYEYFSKAQWQQQLIKQVNNKSLRNL